MDEVNPTNFSFFCVTNEKLTHSIKREIIENRRRRFHSIFLVPLLAQEQRDVMASRASSSGTPSMTTSKQTTPRSTCPCRNLPPVTNVVGTFTNNTTTAALTSSSPTPLSTPPLQPAKVLCADCVEYRLAKLRERRRRILQERNTERQACQEILEASPLETVLDLQYQAQLARERADHSRRQCAQRAIQVARLSCENEERRQKIEAAQRTLIFRPHLARLQSSLLEGGSLDQALLQGRKQVRLLRFEWAKRAFLMHRLDVSIPPDTTTTNTSSTTNRPKLAKGIGKIGGLPLPHAGAELYGVLPPQELESALRLVASVTSCAANCLGIVLPHPILLQTGSATNRHDLAQDTILFDDDTMQETKSPQRTITATTEKSMSSSSTMPSLAASTASLANLVGQTAKKVWGGATAMKNPLLLQDTAQSTVIPPSMDSNIVQERIRHASAAILAEDNTPHSSPYSLSAQVTTQDEYAIALQLLQNDVITLCIRAGVPVAHLWPAQAVLLNLQALYEFCKQQSPGVEP